MVATFNGWDEMPELEREALELWEQERPSDHEEVMGLAPATEMSDALQGRSGLET